MKLSVVDPRTNQGSVSDAEGLARYWGSCSGSASTGTVVGQLHVILSMSTVAESISIGCGVLAPYQEMAETESEETAMDRAINKAVQRIFSQASGEEFEDGYESGFSLALTYLIELEPERTLREFYSRVFSSHAKSATIREGLMTIGEIEQDSSRELRRTILESALSIQDYTINDGALVGLSFLDDYRSIGALRARADREGNGVFKKTIAGVVAQLEETRNAQVSSNDLST